MLINASRRASDVVVVGGGPAGSVTALLLARAGFDVVLLDRARFPRAKPCGDCISPGANLILQQIGVWDAVLACQPARLYGWRLTAPAGASFESDFGVGCTALSLEREKFDAVLLAHAQQAGVRVLTGARVGELVRQADGGVSGVRARHGSDLREYHARLVVGADGLRSVVARRLAAHRRRPRLRKTSFTTHVPLPGRAAVGQLRLARGACLGIAPVTAEPLTEPLHNLTLVLNDARYHGQDGPAQIMQHWLSRFGLQLNSIPHVLTSGPFDWPVHRMVYDGAALVGDAAGYYDPFTGQGIFRALAGAQLLAQQAEQALRTRAVTRRTLLPYETAYRRFTTATHHVQRVVEFVCSRPRLAERSFARLARETEIARALVGVTGDLLPVRSLLSPRLWLRLVT